MRKVAVVVAGVPVPPLDNYLKRLKINYILIGVVTLLLALALWPNITAQRRGGQLRDHLRGELRISTLNSPLTYFNTKQGPGGLDYELAKRFANYLGVKLVVIPIRTSMTCSTIWTTTTPTCWRPALSTTGSASAARAPARPTTPFPNSWCTGWAPAAKGFADIKGKLAVASGSAHVSTLKQLKQDKYPDLARESSSDLTSKELLERVADGKLDYTLGDSVTIALLQRIHPQLAVAFDVTDEEPVTGI